MFNLIINTAHAADASTVIDNITSEIINPIIAVMFGFAFIVFLYGVVEFIQGSSNEKEVEKGKQHIIWGILGVVIMVAAMGIVNMISSTVTTLGGS